MVVAGSPSGICLKPAVLLLGFRLHRSPSFHGGAQIVPPVNRGLFLRSTLPHEEQSPRHDVCVHGRRGRPADGSPSISLTGRTSTVPQRAPGIRAATAIASSRSPASIRK